MVSAPRPPGHVRPLAFAQSRTGDTRLVNSSESRAASGFVPKSPLGEVSHSMMR